MAKKETKLRVAIGADHGGFSLKNELVERLCKQYDIVDLGAFKLAPHDDYPDFAESVAKAVASGKAQRGILVCGSGVGACIAANKAPSVRACLCHDTYSARQGVEHDDMNVLCLGARVIGIELATELATAFLNARFSKEARHRRRLKKVLAIEKRALQLKKGQDKSRCT
jgi:ribose 5-phosphate isomerase B